MSQTAQLPVNSLILTGSATTTNGRITAYLWSMVSGPNVPVVHSPGARITSISNLVAGSYLFQLMATDTAGLTGVDIDVKNMVSTMVNTSSNHGFVLQLQNEVAYNIRNFSSSRYSNPAKHPRLVVTYQP